jgi:hypothetical protein
VSQCLTLPASPSQWIKSPLLSCQISALSVSLCRFVRDSTDSDAGSCRQVTGRSAASEHPPSTHGRRCIGPVPLWSVTVRETLGNNISADLRRPVAMGASDGCPFGTIGRERSCARAVGSHAGSSSTRSLSPVPCALRALLREYSQVAYGGRVSGTHTPGSKNRRPAPHHDVGKTIKREKTLTARFGQAG